MAVTMQQIADLAGVSRGTVDRALNNRGRIRPEVAEKIKMIAKELGYQPNIAAKALSSGNQILRIGVILQYADTPTIQTVLEGAKDAKQEVERFGGIPGGGGEGYTGDCRDDRPDQGWRCKTGAGHYAGL